MSIDDECPTQYFGPDGVEVTIQGKRVRLHKDEYLRLTEKPGALTDEEMLNAKWDGLSLADILAEANKQHRPGCASSRGRDCTCDYLAQWDPKTAGQECIEALDNYVAEHGLAGPGILMLPGGWCIPASQAPEPLWVTGDQLPPRETGR